MRGLSDHVHGWIEEGLIKTFRAANKLTNTKGYFEDDMRFGESSIGEDFESLRFMPLSQLDAVADSFRWGSAFLLGAEGALLGSATTMAEGIPGAQLVIPSLILTDVTSSMTLLRVTPAALPPRTDIHPKKPTNLPHLDGGDGAADRDKR